MPDAKLYGPDGVAESGFATRRRRHPGRRRRRRPRSRSRRWPRTSTRRRARSSSSDYEAKYGEAEPGPVRDLRLRGDAAGARRDQALGDGRPRQAVLEALFATKDRESVLGTYSIDENGDTTLTDYGVYTIDRTAS